jgi:hypothetical protein
MFPGWPQTPRLKQSSAGLTGVRVEFTFLNFSTFVYSQQNFVPSFSLFWTICFCLDHLYKQHSWLFCFFGSNPVSLAG